MTGRHDAFEHAKVSALIVHLKALISSSGMVKPFMQSLRLTMS